MGWRESIRAQALRRLTTCTQASKDGVGSFYVHTWWWSRSSIAQVFFQPSGQERLVVVPEAARQEVLDAETVEQAMAAIRRH